MSNAYVPPRPSIASRVSAAIGSYWLSVTTLSFLFVLTIIGTIEQTKTSLFEVQQRYFESAFVVHKVYGIPVPLPGVYLLLVILAVNLVWGGLVRIRKAKTTIGVIVGHIGILSMLAGAAVEFTWSQKGKATIREGDESAEFESYYEWEIAIAEAKDAGPVTEHVIPGERFMHLTGGRRATFSSPAVPFELTVHDVLPSCVAEPVGSGFALREVPKHIEAEIDEAGAYVTVTPKSGAPVDGVLWARERFPMSVEVDGHRWTIGLAHRRWPLPFAVRLDKFHKEMHPGLGMAKAFESDVTKIQDGVPQQMKVSMNAPLRQSGYTLYQSGFQEPRRMGDPWASTFSVVKNPADRVPLWSCVVITAGLLLHFCQKLVRHVRSQKWRTAS